jgi:hypothetical protein
MTKQAKAAFEIKFAVWDGSESVWAIEKAKQFLNAS